MVGIGTLVNTAAVIAGGLIGSRIKSGPVKKMEDVMMKSCGISVILIGISGSLKEMIAVTGTEITVQGTMLLIFSLVLGSIAGSLMDFEGRMELIGVKLKIMTHRENDSTFVDGFVSTSLVICIGAMAIVGSIQDGLTGDYSMLVAKAILDFIIVLFFATTYGLGAGFAAVPVFLLQGSITLLSYFLGEFFSQALISDLSMIGSALILCVGLNLSFGKRFQVANMLPALLVPVIYRMGMSFIFNL